MYDGSNNLLMRFNYADDRLPVSMSYGGATYYLMYDQVGTLRAVVNNSGNIIKQVDYDSFGNIINDSNPSLGIPFGFAGGLHDRDTGLVRFGYRDYSPEIARWTAKDPIDFAGGDENLFGYVESEPQQNIDPTGLTIWVCNRPAGGATGWLGGNHSYLYDDTTNKSCGMGGSSGSGGTSSIKDKGPKNGGHCNEVPCSKGKEKEIMDYCDKHANDGLLWIPWLNDCHNKVDQSLTNFGLNNPGAPGGRVGTIP